MFSFVICPRTIIDYDRRPKLYVYFVIRGTIDKGNTGTTIPVPYIIDIILEKHDLFHIVYSERFYTAPEKKKTIHIAAN